MHTIEALEARPIVGNFHSDSRLFADLHEFIWRDDVTLEEQMRAVRMIDVAMGEEQAIYTRADVEQYKRESPKGGA